MNRGPIFLCDENWGFFIRLLRRYFKPENADILAYCLLPNHYHLLVRLNADELSQRVMQPLSVSYTKAVNKQQGRVGPLFQGPFPAAWVDNDAYLTHVSRYIHWNPVAAELVECPADWAYSSYRDYVGLRDGTLPIIDIMLSQFPSRRAFGEFVEFYDAGEVRKIDHLLFDED